MTAASAVDAIGEIGEAAAHELGSEFTDGAAHSRTGALPGPHIQQELVNTDIVARARREAVHQSEQDCVAEKAAPRSPVDAQGLPAHDHRERSSDTHLRRRSPCEELRPRLSEER